LHLPEVTAAKTQGFLPTVLSSAGEGDQADVGAFLLGPAPAARHLSKFKAVFVRARATEGATKIGQEVGLPKDLHDFLRLYIDTAPTAAIYLCVRQGGGESLYPFKSFAQGRSSLLSACVAEIVTGATKEVGPAGGEIELAGPDVAGRAAEPDLLAAEGRRGALDLDGVGPVNDLSTVTTAEIIDEIDRVIVGVKEDGPRRFPGPLPGTPPARLAGEVPRAGTDKDVQGEALIHGLLGHLAFSRARGGKERGRGRPSLVERWYRRAPFYARKASRSRTVGLVVPARMP
jgi:hypothetical protein